jgi:hypothetical protein
MSSKYHYFWLLFPLQNMPTFAKSFPKQPKFVHFPLDFFGSAWCKKFTKQKDTECELVNCELTISWQSHLVNEHSYKMWDRMKTHLNCISSHINLPFGGSWPFDSSSTRSFIKHYIIFPFAFVWLHHLNNQDTSDMAFHPLTWGLYCLLSNCWIVGYDLVMDELFLPVTLILADKAEITNCYHMSSNASQLTYLLSV